MKEKNVNIAKNVLEVYTKVREKLKSLETRLEEDHTEVFTFEYDEPYPCITRSKVPITLTKEEAFTILANQKNKLKLILEGYGVDLEY